MHYTGRTEKHIQADPSQTMLRPQREISCEKETKPTMKTTATINATKCKTSSNSKARRIFGGTSFEKSNLNSNNTQRNPLSTISEYFRRNLLPFQMTSFKSNKNNNKQTEAKTYIRLWNNSVISFLSLGILV